jgi:DNA-binding CsgD family transcriptional regulator
MQSLPLSNEPALIQHLYGALIDPAGFHHFLEALTLSIGGEAAELLVIRRNPLRVENVWYYGLSEELLQWYIGSDMIAVDIVINTAIRQAPGAFQTALTYVEETNPDEGSVRWEEEQGMLDAAWLVVESSADECVLLTIQRTVEQGAFQPHEIGALNRLAPYIRQAVGLNRQLASRSDASSSLAAIIDVLPDATLVLDSYSTVLHSNKAARALLDRERSLAIRDERLSFSETALQSAFFLASTQVVRASIGREGHYTETLFLKRAGRQPLIFVLRPIESSELLAGGALLTIYEPGHRQLPNAEQIAGYFELTVAESQVCEHLVAGMDLQAIADHLGRKISTVRYQLKQVFQKTACTRQGELVSSILAALLR